MFTDSCAQEFDGDSKTPGLEPYTLIADPCKRVPKLVKKRLTRSLSENPRTTPKHFDTLMANNLSKTRYQ